MPFLQEYILNVISKLTDRERDILVSRFGLFDEQGPRTLEEVGRSLGLSKERIRQIQEKALRKLRKIVDPEVVESTLS